MRFLSSTMMPMAVRRWWILTAISLMIGAACCLAYNHPGGSQPLFWEREFEVALASRQRFCESMKLGPATELYGLKSAADWQAFGERVLYYENAENPWFCLFSGIAVLRTSGQSDISDTANAFANNYFTKALHLCSEHPGLGWALAEEFRRFGLLFWEDQSLRTVEKIFIAGGAQSAPILSQQLMWYALKAQQEQRPDDARRYLTWAAAFERYSVWPALRSAWISFPGNPAGFSQAMDDLSLALRESWPFVLSLARFFDRWIVTILSIFVVGIMVAVGLKYVPRAAHGLSHRYPEDVNLHLARGYAIGLYLSTIFLGVLPFLWLTGALTWRYLTRLEKYVVGVCLFLVALVPLHTRFRDIITQPIVPGNALYYFEKSIDEGYYPELETAVEAYRTGNPHDYLGWVTSAVVALKKTDTAAAGRFIMHAESMQPSDPVVLLTAANVFQVSQDMKRANDYFTRCITTFPELEASFFNPCLLYFDNNRIVEGIDLIRNASKLNPKKVGTFTRKNDDYFAGNWPPLRQFLQPDYRPDFFVRDVLPRYWGSWATADQAWGTSFLGIPLVSSAILSWVFFALIMVFPQVRRRAAEGYTCRLCGIPMCRTCKRGDMCHDCHKRAGDIHDIAVIQHIRQGIIAGHQRRSRMLPHIVDILFPGLGSLIFSNPAKLSGILLVLLTAVLYGSYVTAATVSFRVPLWMAQGVALPILVSGIFYQGYFLIRRGASIVVLLGKK